MASREKLTTVLSAKGQVVVPHAIREARNWRPGTEFVVEELDGGILLRPRRLRQTRWMDLLGIAKYRGPRKSLRQMDAAVTAEAKRRK